ncbi:MAG TPA: hypothetical protein DCM40_33125 [Maribacter sp.]|jgi:hypothetical protein|nr:hypothetical protein [Maribacter sp.]|tara:strand:+ start:456 stop:662 length:207 start_codon:yes stop_codon:yes gene_type:complete
MGEIEIEKHWSGKTYNVNLCVYEKNGWGTSHCKAFDVPYKQATIVAEKMSDLYHAPIVKDEGKKGGKK